MGLSKSEKQMLERLQQKEKEPDPGPIGRSVQVAINLGDAEQVKMAKRYGFLPEDDDGDDGDDGDGDGDDDDGDEAKDKPPRRRGYFPEGK